MHDLCRFQPKNVAESDAARERAPEPSLLGDQRGAILVIGVFMAIFLTAMLAYVAGIAQTVWYREQLQDAADGSALSAAIIMARGMNLIVLVNLIMEGLVMVILILQLLVTVLAIVALILAACFLYPAAAAVAQIGYQVYDISVEVQDVVFEVLPILHDLEVVVRAVTPFVAEADAVVYSAKDYPVVDFGFMVPSRITLPVESGTYAELCGKAGDDLVRTLVDGIPGVPKMVAKQAGKIAKKVIQALSSWFCGDGSGPSGFESGAPPPEQQKDFNVDWPNLKNRDACIEVNKTMNVPKNSDGTRNNPCDVYSQEVQKRLPGSSHSCEDAKDSSACYSSAEQARSSCNYLTHPQMNDYVYSEGTIEKTFVLTEGEWVEDKSLRRVTQTAARGERPVTNDIIDPTAASIDAAEFSSDPLERTKLGNPCDNSVTHIWEDVNSFNTRSTRAQIPIWREWNETTYADPADEGNEHMREPVCAERMEPLPMVTPKTPLPDGTKETRSVRAVTEVYFCAEEKSEMVPIVQFEADGESDDGGDEDDKAPHLVEKEVYLGDDDFQIRMVIIGRNDGIARPALDAARWGRAEREKESILKFLDNLGNLSVAQSEFFYENGDASKTRDDWMWNMNWRARLKKFTLPFGGDDNQSGGESGGNSGGSAGGSPASAGAGNPNASGRRSSGGTGGRTGIPSQNSGRTAGSKGSNPGQNSGGTAGNTGGNSSQNNGGPQASGVPSLEKAGAYAQKLGKSMDLGSIMKDQLQSYVKSSVLENCEDRGNAGASGQGGGLCGGVISAVNNLGGMFEH